MQANEITFFKLVEGEKQFQVPLYQRTYSWQLKDWKQLWDDVLEQAEIIAEGEDRMPHFIGSIVLAPGVISASDMQRFLVVDGQQRTTTLLLALCALRDAYEMSSPKDANRVNKQFLINEFREGLDHYRLLPTQADPAAFIASLDHTHQAGGKDNVGAGYRFFREALITYAPEGDIEGLRRIEAALKNRLSIVAITADQRDNVFRIFESLNNTGVKLSQSDLLRNYVFMLLPETGAQVFDKVWFPMQTELGPDNLELLAWLDLVLRGDDKAKRTDVYRSQQVRLELIHKTGGEAALEAEIKELYRRGRLLMRLVEPDREEHAELREVLERLQEWGGQIHYPLALHLLDLVDLGKADADAAARALTLIESFLVRRMICRITANVNRLLNSGPKELEDDRPVDEAVHRFLSGPRRFWPSDSHFREAIRTQPFYWTGRAGQRFFVLKALEQSYHAKEPVDFVGSKLSIEHVMPQTPTKEWLELLAEEVTDEGDPIRLHEQLLHTLGNLTLTGENSKLSNHPFQRKQEIFDFSALRMNREIAETPQWGKAAILARAEALTERAIALWPEPLAGGAGLEDDKQTWVLLRQILAALPAGSWTTFGDLATVVGVRAGVVGAYMSNRASLENAHRVLTSEGTASESSRNVLEQEGVSFTAGGAAHPNDRLTSSALAELIGLETGKHAGPAASWEERAARFQLQLSTRDAHWAVAAQSMINRWVQRGGQIAYGTSAETSCFLMLPRPDRPKETIWPLVLYPMSGRIEVIFLYLSTRPPFDQLALRQELMDRLNRIHGLSIPADRIALRPSISMDVFQHLDQLNEILDWFMAQVGTAAPAEEHDDTADLFEEKLLQICEVAETEAGYQPGHIRLLISEGGGVAAAKAIIGIQHVSDGFAALWERGRLDLSVEALVVDPQWAGLFSEDEIEGARRTLKQFGYVAG